MEIEGLCRIEIIDSEGVILGGLLELGDCYPGLLKVIKLKLTNLSAEDLEIHIQSSRAQEVLFLGQNDCVDETFKPELSVSKILGTLCGNNHALSADFCFPRFHRPLVDLLATKLLVSSFPVVSERGSVKRIRTSSGDGISSADEPLPSSRDRYDTMQGDPDDEERFLFHSISKLSFLRPFVISKNRKLQHKVRGEAPGRHVDEWRIQVSAKCSGYVSFLVFPTHTAINNDLETKSIDFVLKWKLQRPSSNVYSFRRALWARNASKAVKNEGVKSIPLSVSRSLALPFGDCGCSAGFSNLNIGSDIIEMRCSGKLCLSTVTVYPSVINFGECNVGDFKSASISLTNVSNSVAVIVPFFESETITISTKHIVLKPGQTSRVTIDYVVRIVDPAYSKIITFVNLVAPKSELSLEVRARNVDTRQMLLHDLFYKIYTYSGSRQIILYSKQCMFRCPTIRIFSIRNVFSEPLDVKLTSENCGEVSVYRLENVSVESDGDALNALKAQKVDNQKVDNRYEAQSSNNSKTGRDAENVGTSLFPGDDLSSLRSLDIESVVESLTALYRCSSDVSKAVEQMCVVDTPKGKNNRHNNHAYSTSNAAGACADVEECIARRCEHYIDVFQKLSSACLECNEESPVFTPVYTLDRCSHVKIPAGSIQHFAVVISPCCCDNPDELESVEFFSKIYLELLSIDKLRSSNNFLNCEATNHATPTNCQEGNGSSICPLSKRTIPIHVFVTRSEFVVMQKNINFGKSIIGDPPARKSVVLVNRSSIPLVYVITKSRSIASEYMKLSPGGHRGIIPPKSSRTVQISFKPTLAGNFEEVLVVRNVFNHTNIESIVVKSVVLKPEKFILLSSTVLESELPVYNHSHEDEDVALIEASRLSGIDSIRKWMALDTGFLSDAVTPAFLGEIFVGDPVETALLFKVRNVTPKKRDFIIDAGHSNALVALRSATCQFEPVMETLSSICTLICTFKEITEDTTVHSMDVLNEYQDKLEKYKQDLKKAQRKNKQEKVLKIQNIIKKIELILDGGKITALDDAVGSDPDQKIGEQADLPNSETSPAPAYPDNKSSGVVRDSTVFHFQLEPEKEISLSVTVRLIPGRSYSPWAGSVLPFVGQLRVFENKNEDFIKYVSFSALVHSQDPSSNQYNLENVHDAEQESSLLRGLIGPLVSETSLISSVSFLSEKSRSVNDFGNNSNGQNTDSNVRKQNTRYIAVVANWCSCQTKRIFPRHRSFKKRTLPVACKLVQVSTTATNLTNGHFVVKMHGLISITPTMCGEMDMSLWLEKEFEDNPVPEYSMLSDENGPIVVSVISSRGESRHQLHTGIERAAFIALNIEEGETIDFLIQWVPSSRGIANQKFAALLGLNLERRSTVEQQLTIDADNFCLRVLPDITQDVSKDPYSTLFVPVVCFMERTTSIKVEKYLSLGDVPLGSSISVESCVRNISEYDPLHYVTNLVDLNSGSAGHGRLQIVGGSTGVVVPGGSKKLEFLFAAVAIGKFDQELLVTNMNEIFDQKRILVTANVTTPQSNFVSFPDVENVTEVDSNLAIGMHFDLGIIQVTDPSATADFSYIGEENSRPFRISNISDKKLYVTAHSNIKKQCFIFADVTGSVSVSSMPLDAGATKTIYVSIKSPIISSEVKAKKSFDRDSLAEIIRDLVGGIRFAFYERDTSPSVELSSTAGNQDNNFECTQGSYTPPLIKLFETRPIQIRAILGCSVMSLHSPTLKYRCVPTCHRSKRRMFRGYFVIQNHSKLFRLRYKYSRTYQFCFTESFNCLDRSVEEIRDADIFKIVVPPGEVAFLLLDSSENSVAPGCSECIEYVVIFNDMKGLFSKTIDVMNFVTGDHQLLELSFFFDPQILVSSVSNLLPRKGFEDKREKALGGGVEKKDRLFCSEGSSGIRYSEGVFVTAIDSLECSCPFWIEKVSTTPDVQRPLRNDAIKLLCRGTEPIADKAVQRAVNSNLILANEIAFQVLGCSDPNGFMCEWTISNPHETAVRVTPVSNLPLLMTTKLLTPMYSESTSRSFSSTRHSHSTVKKNQSLVTSEVFSNFVFNANKAKVTSDVSFTESQDRSVDRSMSIVALPYGLHHDDLHHCGDAFCLNAGESIAVRLHCEVGGIVAADICSDLETKEDSGGTSHGDGMVAFISTPQTVASFFAEPHNKSDIYSAVDREVDSQSGRSNVLGLLYLKCKFVTPRIVVPATVVSRTNVRQGQRLSLSLEVLNVSDVEVPVAIKNLPEWMKIEKATGDVKYFGSAISIPARASFKFTLLISSVPGGKRTSESILQHDIFVCNMCRAFSGHSYERTRVSIELSVSPALPLLVADDNGWLSSVGANIFRSCLKMGSLRIPYDIETSPATVWSRPFPEEEYAIRDLSTDLSCQCLVLSDMCFTVSNHRLNLTHPLQTSISSSFHVRNALSRSVHVDVELLIDANFKGIADLNVRFEGSVVPVQTFDMLPGESIEFSVVFNVSSFENLSELLLPFYTVKLCKPRNVDRAVTIVPTERSEDRKGHSSSDDSDSSDSECSMRSSDDDDEMRSDDEDVNLTAVLRLCPGNEVGIIGNADFASSLIDLPTENSIDSVTIRNVYFGQLVLRPQEVEYLSACASSETEQIVSLDNISIDLICDVSLPIIFDDKEIS